ncbi:phage terminase large subunit [Geothrix mesophila]|uniref:phage terminase large subunit n=1 Tax=Geothrix mesophila TaxID=2922723 RepID=UPI001FABC6FC
MTGKAIKHRATRAAGGDPFTKDEFNALLRQDLYAFTIQSFRELERKTEFLPNWHQVLITNKLEACMRGECRRLIINLPPRHFKSLFASIALPAFWLGRDPSAKIVCASYTQDLANKLARSCRQVMGAAWYREAFPLTRMSAKRDAVGEFLTTEGGYRLSLGVEGGLMGRGGDIIIVDDPLDPNMAASDVQRAHVNDWFDRTLYSRLDNQKTGVIIIVMQRLHMDDLVGHVLEKDDWEVLSLPAIAEEEERHEIRTLGEVMTVVRRPGDLLHEAHLDREALDRLRKNQGEYAFSAQYQQSPVPPGGAMVKAAWWRFYERRPESFNQVIQSWDTACKKSEYADYSVCTTWGMKDRKLHLLDVFREKLDYPDLKRAVKLQAEKHKPAVILIEDMTTGSALLQELPSEGMRGLKGCKPVGDKVTRLYTHLTWIEGGNVLLPMEAPWLAEYRRELESFPQSKRKDQVDSTSQVLAWAQANRWVGVDMIRVAGTRLSHSAALHSYVHGSSSYFGP